MFREKKIISMIILVILLISATSVFNLIYLMKENLYWNDRAGYIISNQTNGKFSNITYVSAEWKVQPILNWSEGAMVQWIGISNSYLNGDSDNKSDVTHEIIQLGTRSRNIEVPPEDTLWYQIRPQMLKSIVIFNVSPGDLVKVSIWEVENGTWTIYAYDLTKGKVYSNTIKYSFNNTYADFVVENPTIFPNYPNESFKVHLPFPSFPNAEFDNITAKTGDKHLDLCGETLKRLLFVNSFSVLAEAEPIAYPFQAYCNSFTIIRSNTNSTYMVVPNSSSDIS